MAFFAKLHNKGCINCHSFSSILKKMLFIMIDNCIFLALPANHTGSHFKNVKIK